MTNIQSSQAFSAALEFVLRWEGGYVFHPADKGGETNFGITSAVYKHYRIKSGLPLRSVRLITQEEVRQIYHQNYWFGAQCSLLPSKLALCHFDWAVNAGTSRAIKTLQQVVGVSADGIIGPVTIKAINTALATHKEIWLCDRYNAIRESCYRRWGVDSQAVFLKGWLNRLDALRGEVA